MIQTRKFFCIEFQFFLNNKQTRRSSSRCCSCLYYNFRALWRHSSLPASAPPPIINCVKILGIFFTYRIISSLFEPWTMGSQPNRRHAAPRYYKVNHPQIYCCNALRGNVLLIEPPIMEPLALTTPPLIYTT